MDKLLRKLTGYFYAAFLLLCCFALQAQNSYKIDVATNSENRKLVLLNSPLSLDSLTKWIVKQTKLPAENIIIIPLDTVNGMFSIYEYGTAEINVASNRNFYYVNRDFESYKSAHAGQSIGDRPFENLLFEVDDYDYTVVKFNLFTFNKDYKFKGGNKVTKSFKFNKDDISYRAKGRLTPAEIAALAERITIDPEDRNIKLSFRINLPKELIEKEDIYIEIITLSGITIRMLDKIPEASFEVDRGSIDIGHYNLVIMNADKQPIKSFRLHMLAIDPRKEPAKDEE